MWDLFDALTCPHPMLADISDFMLPPFSEGDYKQWDERVREKYAHIELSGETG